MPEIKEQDPRTGLSRYWKGKLEQWSPVSNNWVEIPEGSFRVLATGRGFVTIVDKNGATWYVSSAETGGETLRTQYAPQPGVATAQEAQAQAPPGYHPVQNQTTGRWFYAPDTKTPDQWENPNPARYEWVQQTVTETNPDTGEPMEPQTRWVLQEKAPTPASLQAQIDALLSSGTPADFQRARELYNAKQALELESPGYQQGREDAATAERRRQLEWDMQFAASQDERDWAGQQWQAEFGQRQWEASQQAQRDALRLGIDIARSPADYMALENLRYGSQPNREYTGAEVAPRTWVADWLAFANRPQPGVPPLQPRITTPGFTPTYAQRTQAPTGGTPVRDEATSAENAALKALKEASAGNFVPPPNTVYDPKTGFYRPVQPDTTLPPLDTRAGPPTSAAPGGAPSAPVTQPIPQPPPGFDWDTGDAVPPEEEGDTENGVRSKAIPMFDAPGESPYALPATRFLAKKGKETAIINEREIPSFLDGGFHVNEKVKLYDFPWLGGGSRQSPLARLPARGVKEALFGQPVSRPRPWSTLGAPVTPSAQSWARLPWEGRQIFQSQVEQTGVPWQSYADEMASLWPTGGTPAPFRRVPNLLGGGRI